MKNYDHSYNAVLNVYCVSHPWETMNPDAEHNISFFSCSPNLGLGGLFFLKKNHLDAQYPFKRNIIVTGVFAVEV